MFYLLTYYFMEDSNGLVLSTQDSTGSTQLVPSSEDTNELVLR